MGDEQLRKRELFAYNLSSQSTITTLDSFQSELTNVLDRNEDSSGLKAQARKAESLVLGWIDFCEEIGFYAFHKVLLTIFEPWIPLIAYIKTLPATVKNKHLKNIKSFLIKCPKGFNIPQAVQVCHATQEEIGVLLDSKSKTTKSTSTSCIPSLGDLFADEGISPEFFAADDTNISEGQLTEREEREEFKKIFLHKYTFVPGAGPVLKNTGEGMRRTRTPDGYNDLSGKKKK